MRPAPGSYVALSVPASSANLGPGFDSVGLAIDLRDRLTAQVTGDALVIAAAGEGAGDVPLDERHLVYRSMVALWERLEVAAPTGLRLECTNAVPHSRGLGSSASAIVAGVAAAAALSGLDPTCGAGRDLVNDVAGDLEGHPDNSSASVFGGLTLSWPRERGSGWRTVELTPHPDLAVVALVPQAQLATHVARAALPTQVPLATAAANGARVGLLVHALTQEPHLLLPGTVDLLHQEQRRPSYPMTMMLVDRLRAAGLAATVSGAGPTVLVLGTIADLDQVPDLLDTLPADQVGWTQVPGGVPAAGLRVESPLIT